MKATIVLFQLVVDPLKFVVEALDLVVHPFQRLLDVRQPLVDLLKPLHDCGKKGIVWWEVGSDQRTPTPPRSTKLRRKVVYPFEFQIVDSTRKCNFAMRRAGGEAGGCCGAGAGGC